MKANIRSKSLFSACALSLAVSASSMALEYGSSIEDTTWSVTGSVFECRFAQTIPRYGEAVFFHQAGEDVKFQLYAKRNLLDYTQAQVSITPPPWRPSRYSESLGSVQVQQDKSGPYLTLDSKRTNQFIHALLDGQWPVISHHTYYDEKEFVKLHVSSIGFPDFYPIYLSCVDQLLHYNFKQVANSKVLFDEGGDSFLDPQDTKVLDRVAYYIQHDPRVFIVYLDGHTDNTGKRFDNREVSRARVENVERYLVKKGINPDIITTRFHGERYPIADNATAKGRAQNRRVTIRLEMREDMPIPDELMFKPENH